MRTVIAGTILLIIANGLSIYAYLRDRDNRTALGRILYTIISLVALFIAILGFGLYLLQSGWKHYWLTLLFLPTLLIYYKFWAYNNLDMPSEETALKCCNNCRYPDSGTCSKCEGVEGTTEISGDFVCKNWRPR